jgi:serine/threonine-protein kinase
MDSIDTLDSLTNERFGKYLLLRRLAIGGMAEVSLARLEGEAGFNKLVVIKQVLPEFSNDRGFTEMFLDEGRLAARLSHSNIAQTFDLGRVNDRYYIAMEYVPGESLISIRRRAEEKNHQLPLGCALRIVMQVLEALAYAHSLAENGQPLNIVHRDVSPSNIVIDFHGGVKLLDFGIARARTQSHHTGAEVVIGKFGYMAPEQCRKVHIDHRADLYAAGAVLYELATGVRPFEQLRSAGPIAVMEATLMGRFPEPKAVRGDLPDVLSRIIVKAMALSPEDRYRSAQAMLTDLEGACSQLSIYPGARELADLMRALYPEKASTFVNAEIPVSAITFDAPEEPERVDMTQVTMLGAGAVDETRYLARPAPVSSSVWWLRIMVAGLFALALPLVVAATLRLLRTPDVGPPPAQPIEHPPVPPPPPVLAAPSPAPDPAPAAEAAPPAPERPDDVGLDLSEPKAVPHAGSAKPSSPGTSASPPSKSRGSHGGSGSKDKDKERDKDRDKESAKASAGPPGELRIDSTPWANISENGSALGATPLTLQLSAGTHKLVLENPRMGLKRTISVQVKAGEVIRRFERLQE